MIAQNDGVERVLREIRKIERTCILVDNPSLWRAIRGMCLKNRRLNYIKFRDFLADGRASDVRFYHKMLSVTDLSDADKIRKYESEVKFYKGIEEIGYIVISLEQGHCVACDIVYDMALHSKTGVYKSFILVTGDEIYARSIHRVRSETGLPVDVAFFGKVHPSLIKEASRFIDLDGADKNVLFRSSSTWA